MWNFRVRLTDSQYEVLKKVIESSRDTLEEWLHSTVIGGLETDIDLFWGQQKHQRKAVQNGWHQAMSKKVISK